MNDTPETKDVGNIINPLPSPEILKAVLVTGDLAPLTPDQQNEYYLAVCRTLRLNPLTQPFAYIKLNNKLQLYPKKDCTDQLRSIYNISVTVVGREKIGDVYCVTARARHPSGREDSDDGTVFVGSNSGDVLANLMMKAVTKAKRRVTLSICGLGMTDESELETIPEAVIEFPPRGKKIDAKQLDELRKMAEATKTDVDGFLKMMFSGIDRLEDIPASDFDRCLKALLRKQASMQKEPAQ